MSNVVTFPAAPAPAPEPAKLWVCMCGCCTFELLSGGHLHCANCGTEVTEEGGWHVPGAGLDAWRGNPPLREVNFNGHTQLARARAELFAQSADASMILTVRSSGEIHMWIDIETAEQREWLSRRLAEVDELLTALKVPEPRE